jgi:hypothetical protein
MLDALDGEDDWSRDTIADASPIESRPVVTIERGASGAFIRPDREASTEPTAEDHE